MKKTFLLIVLISISLKVKAQIDSNGNLQIGYNNKIYSVSVEPFKFELTPFTTSGHTEFRNYYATGNYKFFVSNGTHGNGNTIGLLIKENGNIGIGTNNPGSWKLAVNGNIRAKEIKVETGWSDFVFFKDYKLPTLEEVESHIKEKGHLKDIPSAKEVEKNGIYLGEMDSKLLQKIEELTLYTIEQEKQLKTQDKEIQVLKKEIESLKLLTTKFLELQKRLEKNNQI
ncbi:hypothetical protein [Flavivirga eckloniae]|uniref:BZIP transcription factor n=1 Tax=Flavivirga eckloniae TaxID=1803846 RepID=A0A2K9PVM3_9FLAO|nr:hypothetical protein [Flavivirga eckloniae]AUP80557.1 hypothetical protein C1H87_18295 [Flavivirga eckloniae]